MKEIKEPEIIDESVALKKVNSTELQTNAEENPLITDERLLSVYEGVLDQIEKDRDEASELLVTFIDMVTNDGESSAAAKEAIVNLMKLKADTADKKIKIADLMTRIKLKERNTMPGYLAAQQHNTYNFGPNKSEEDTKQMLMDEINKHSKKGTQ